MPGHTYRAGFGILDDWYVVGRYMAAVSVNLVCPTNVLRYRCTLHFKLQVSLLRVWGLGSLGFLASTVVCGCLF